ncbi:MAG TPA: lamin tail domain-containing protein [Streptosporangiaceae bacterium]|jgi:hypothetical protein
MKMIKLGAALAGAAMSIGTLAMSGSPAQASSAQPSSALAASPIRLYKIYYNSPGPDRGGNASLNAEYVELHNTAGSAINLTDWVLHDGGQRHTYTFPTFTLKAHGYVLIHTGRGGTTPSQLYWGQSWYVWNNDGDTATLKDRHNDVIGRCSYSDPHERRSYKNC